MRKPKDYHKSKYDICKSKGIRLFTLSDPELLDRDLLKDILAGIFDRSARLDENKISVKMASRQDFDAMARIDGRVFMVT